MKVIGKIMKKMAKEFLYMQIKTGMMVNLKMVINQVKGCIHMHQWKCKYSIIFRYDG
jgi:hypothetical protein